MLSALKEEKKTMRGEVRQMTTDFADQLDNVHSKLNGVSQQLDGTLTTMLGLSADLKSNVSTLLDPFSAVLSRLNIFRYQNGLCLLILWNGIISKLLDL